MGSNAKNAFRPRVSGTKPQTSNTVNPLMVLSHPEHLSPMASNVLGLVVSGDLGDLTIYTDRFGKKIVFPKSPPKDPPSAAQTVQRERFRSAQQAYMALTSQEKIAYEDLALAASLCATGQNLFIHVSLKHSFEFLATLQRQWGIPVPNPPAF